MNLFVEIASQLLNRELNEHISLFILFIQVSQILHQV